MVAPSKAASVRASVLAAIACLALHAAAPIPLRPQQASARTPPDFTPTHAGKTAAVKGVVSAPAISFLDYQQIAMEEGGYGLVLEGPVGSFDKLTPGDE